MRLWRALNGPEKEVFFSQVYKPAEQCQSDFTEMNSVGITILGQPFLPTLQSKVEEALAKLLERGELPEYEAVKQLSGKPEPIVWPELSLPEPDLGFYDQLVGTSEVVT